MRVYQFRHSDVGPELYRDRVDSPRRTHRVATDSQYVIRVTGGGAAYDLRSSSARSEPIQVPSGATR